MQGILGDIFFLWEKKAEGTEKNKTAADLFSRPAAVGKD